jgi:outer membrane protein assembly factor BamE
MRSIAVAGVLLLSVFATGCSWLPSVAYKLEINQGNYITQDMVERLKVGMTRQQVRSVLGSPMITDVFHADRWDYVYELRQRGRRVEHRQFVVLFADDRLVRWEGDEMPQSAAALNRAAGTTSKVPPPPNTTLFESIREKLGW